MNSRDSRFLNDLEMQEAEEAAAEAEAERGGRFHLEREARVIETQLAHCRAQGFEVVRIDREETAEHDWDRGLEARRASR